MNIFLPGGGWWYGHGTPFISKPREGWADRLKKEWWRGLPSQFPQEQTGMDSPEPEDQDFFMPDEPGTFPDVFRRSSAAEFMQ